MKFVRSLRTMFRTVQMKLIIIYVLLILFALQLIGIYFIRTMENSFTTNFSNTLYEHAQLIAQYVEPFLAEGQDGKSEDDTASDGRTANAELDDFVSSWYKVINTDIQIIDMNGKVLSTSQPNAAAIVGQKNTEYVVNRALQNVREKDNERIVTDTDGKRKKVIAMPVGSGGKIIGAVYLVASMEEIYETINRINNIFISGMLIALGLTVMLSIILSHTITSPIKEITKQVTSVAEGRFNRRVKVYGDDEIGQLGVAFNEMTDRLQEALSSNEEEKEKLASILANMSDGVIAADERGRVMLINERARQMLNIFERESAKTTIYDLLQLPEPEARRTGEAADGEDGLYDRAIMMEVHHPDEEEPRKLRVTFTPIHRRDRGASGTIVVLHDVTEQEEVERSRREFVANVSHELRTPLTTIKSYLEALEDGAIHDPQLANRFVGVTRNEAERMIRLVEDLLHLSRFDSKQATMKKERTDVAGMLEEVADRFSFQLQQRNIGIGFHVASNVEPVLLDRDKIDQVLDNLVSNAIKYTPDGGRIDISARMREPGWVEISVQDTGIGIPKKDLARVFERFYRVDKARSRLMGGTGLGLSIAREIIKAHGGTISLESEYKKGTKVTFALPVGGEKEDAAWKDSNPRH